MPRKRTLIPSPLAWTMQPAPVAPPALPVIPERGGTQLRTPLPVAIIDTREQNPLSFRRFKGWFKSIEHRALPLGDYSIEGMEDSCVVERKDLADLIQSFTTNRKAFIGRLRRMADVPHSLLVVTASVRRDQVRISLPRRESQPNHPIADRRARRPARPVHLHRDARTRRRNRRVVISTRHFCMIGWTATATAAT